MRTFVCAALLAVLLCGCEGFLAAFRPASEQPEHLRRKPKTSAQTQKPQSSSLRTNQRSNSGSFSEVLFSDEDRPTRLTGLNETELAAIREAKGKPRKSSVFNNESFRDNSPLLQESASELNERDSELLKGYIKEGREQSTRDSHWVY